MSLPGTSEKMVEVVKGDYGYNLNFSCVDASGTFIDLTNGSPWFKMGVLNSGVTTLSGACLIDSAVSGTCHLEVGSATFNTAGTFEWELELLYPDKLITTKRNENIIVKNSLP